MKYLLIASLLFLCYGASAQSSFKALPKVYHATNPFAHAAVATPDSTMNAWRFIANIAAYSEPGNILMAGVGYGYQHLVWVPSTQKWNCQWSISPVAFAGGSVVPNTPASVMSVGILGGIVNNTIMAGPVYNFGTKQFGVAISVGINLNN
jgi:hypothetical protein